MSDTRLGGRRFPMRVRVALTALALLVAPAVLAEPAAGESAAAVTIADGVYSKAQAKDGRKLFRTHCRSCHDRNYFRPVFAAWNGEPVGAFFTVLSSTMPESAPGSLAPETYEAILAYILDESGYAEGDAPLKVSSDAFSNLVIAPPGE